MQRINHRDLLLGAIFALIGAGFVIAARGLDMGTTQRMGPGMFPLILASVLMLLGIAIAAQSFFTPEEAIGKVPWRGLGLRENLGNEPQLFRGHGMWRGSGWPPIKRHPGYTVLQSAPSYAAALLEQGRGRKRKADYCQYLRTGT